MKTTMLCALATLLATSAIGGEFNFTVTPGQVEPPEPPIVEPPIEPPPPPPPPPPPVAQLPAERLTDWTHTGIPGGIPHRTRICATLSPGVTAAAITTAITNCGNGGGGVVALNAGTYSAASLAGRIRFERSNVTLRGAGADRTILQGRDIIGMMNGNTFTINVPITAGGTKGSSQITVGSTANLTPGTMIQLARDNDSLIVLRPGLFGRMISQMNAITAVSGNVLTLRNPLFYNFTAGNPTIVNRFTNQHMNGVEDMKLDHAGFTSGAENFFIHHCDSCWVKGVDSAAATNFHFTMQATLNIEFRDNYVSQSPTGPNNAGIRFRGAWSTGSGSTGVNSSFRVENNVLDRTWPAILLSNASSGGYIGYNFVFSSSDPTVVSAILYDSHEPTNMLNLYEGNIAPAWGMSGFHGGSAVLGAVLRNYFTGFDPRSNQRGEPVQLMRAAYSYSLLGNVLGSSQQNPTAYNGCTMWGSGPRAIYKLGFPNSGNCSLVPHDGWMVPGGYPDARVAATLIRWGNYDYFNRAVRWEQSELPAGITLARALPASLIYDGVPPWWPTRVPWPPIGPDVTRGNGDTSGHVNKIPAQLCWESGLDRGQAFNAARCFPSN